MPPAAAPQESSSANILIVEDERIVAIDLRRILKSLGYRVAGIVSSGEAAIQSVERLQPNAILMDIRLEGELNGIQAAHLIRQQQDIPVIFTTAYHDEETVSQAQVTEPFGYILKPFSERDIATALAMALYKHRIDRALRESERFSRSILDALSDQICVLDAHGMIIAANQAWREAAVRSAHHPLFAAEGEAFPSPNDQAVAGLDQEVLAFLRGVHAVVSEICNTFGGEFPCCTGSQQTWYQGRVTRFRGLQPQHVVVALQDITRRKENEKLLEYLAIHDPLTGLYNRHYFDAELVRLQMGRRFPVTILLLDLKGLREINLRLGSITGDDLLRQAGRVLNSCFRGEDVAARLGSDEFGVLLPGVNAAEAGEVMARLQQAFAAANAHGPGLPITYSIGAATAQEAQDLIDLLKQASEKLCQQKAARQGDIPG